MAVLFAVTLLLIVTIVQAGLWWHASNLCRSAVQQGLDAGRTLQGTSTDAHSAATRFLTQAGSGLLSDPRVRAHAGRTRVTVTASARPLVLLPIPGLTQVQHTAQAATERFTTPGGS